MKRVLAAIALTAALFWLLTDPTGPPRRKWLTGRPVDGPVESIVSSARDDLARDWPASDAPYLTMNALVLLPDGSPAAGAIVRRKTSLSGTGLAIVRRKTLHSRGLGRSSSARVPVSGGNYRESPAAADIGQQSRSPPT